MPLLASHQIFNLISRQNCCSAKSALNSLVSKISDTRSCTRARGMVVRQQMVRHPSILSLRTWMKKKAALLQAQVHILTNKFTTKPVSSHPGMLMIFIRSQIISPQTKLCSSFYTATRIPFRQQVLPKWEAGNCVWQQVQGNVASFRLLS